MKEIILILKINNFYRRTVNGIVYKQYTLDTFLDNKQTKADIIADISAVLRNMESRKLTKKEMKAYKKYNAIIAEIKMFKEN